MMLSVHPAVMVVAAAAPLLALVCFPLVERDQIAVILRDLALPILLLEVAIVITAILRVGLPRRQWCALNRALWLSILFIVALAFLASLSASDFLAISILRTSISLLHLGFGLSIYALLRHGGQIDIDRAIGAVLAGLLLFVVIAAAFVMTRDTMPGFDWAYFGLAVSNIRQSAFTMGFAGSAILGFLVASRTWPRRLLLGSALTMVFAIGFWSGTRGIFLAVIGAFLLLPFFAGWRRIGETAPIVIAALLLAAPLSTLHTVNDPRFGFDRVIGSSINQAPDRQTSGRLEMWREAVGFIAASPVLGYGEGRYTKLTASGGNIYNHPHNVFLQWGFQWGVPAALLAIGWMIWPMRRVRKHILRNDGRGLPAMLGLAALWIVGLFEGSFFHVYPLMLISFLTASLLAWRNSQVGAMASRSV